MFQVSWFGSRCHTWSVVQPITLFKFFQPQLYAVNMEWVIFHGLASVLMHYLVLPYHPLVTYNNQVSVKSVNTSEPEVF